MTRITITLPHITCYAKHGVTPQEQTIGQLFLVYLRLQLNTTQAGSSDALQDTVDYVQVREHVLAQLRKQPPAQLLEHLAYRTAQHIIHTFAHIEEVHIRIQKPHARLGDSRTPVSVQLDLTRSDLAA